MTTSIVDWVLPLIAGFPTVEIGTESLAMQYTTARCSFFACRQSNENFADLATASVNVS